MSTTPISTDVYDEKDLYPGWLVPLLKTPFFQSCPSHGTSGKSECNMYCLHCLGEAQCSSCISRHRDHYVVQVRRSSYHDVIRVNELQKVLDVSGIQTYVINSAKVVFLNERPQPKPAKGINYQCETCERSLVDPTRFCSLGCKLSGIKRRPDMSFMLNAAPRPMATTMNGGGNTITSAELEDGSTSKKENAKKNESSTTSCPHFHTANEPWVENENPTDRRNLSSAISAHMQSLQLDMSPRTPPQPTTSRTAKRRKGIPHRAPNF